MVGSLTLHKGGGSRSFMTMIMTIWWPSSGVWIYQIVTGVTSVVGVPSTHLVLFWFDQAFQCSFSFQLTNFPVYSRLQQSTEGTTADAQENRSGSHCQGRWGSVRVTSDVWSWCWGGDCASAAEIGCVLTTVVVETRKRRQGNSNGKGKLGWVMLIISFGAGLAYWCPGNTMPADTLAP